MQFILRELFQDYTHTNFRSSHRSCSVEKSVLKKLLRAKRLCWSLFCSSRFKPETYNFIKKKPYHWCFPTNIAKFLRTHTLTNIFEPSLLNSLHICTSFLWNTIYMITVSYSHFQIKDSDITKRFFYFWALAIEQMLKSVRRI